MKRKLTRAIALAMSLMMVTATATGCGSSAKPSTEPSTAPTEAPVKGDEATEAPEETYDFGGVTVKAWGGIYNNLLSQEVDKKFTDAKEYVEKKYNIKFEAVQLDGHDGTNETAILQTSVAAGAPAADIVSLNPQSIIGCIQNKLLFDQTSYIDSFEVGSAYTDAMTWDGKCYGISYDDLGSCWVMVYDRDKLKSIGMEKTPTDMFMEGKWDYQSFKNYLSEMKSKLPEGEYPIGAYPYHWGTMATAANGAPMMTSDGTLNLTNEAFVEAVELYSTLQKEGLAAPVEEVTKDDGTTGYKHHYAVDDDTIVLKRAEQWQLGSLSNNFGIVPYPWGSNVTCEGDYTTLSDNYQVSLSYWSGYAILDASVQTTGIPGDVLMKISKDFEGACRDMEWLRDAYLKEKAGEKVVFARQLGDVGNFTTQEDVAINDFMHERFVFDWSWCFDAAEYMQVWKCFSEIYGQGKDPRATLESYYNEAMANLKEAGLVK